jgi:Protein of unknown function (DUF1566)
MTSRRVALLLALAGCGSSGNAPPASDASDDGGVDAATDAEVGAPSCAAFPMPNPASAGLPNPATYTVNADGTITDDVTGLVWEGAVEATLYMQEGAIALCTAKGGGWRLPTRLELVSLVDFTIAAPGPTIASVFANAPGDLFWTSSLYYGDATGDAWYVGFDEGYSDYGIINQSYLARCVRAPAPKCFAQRYEAQAGGLVLDHATGLVWQQTLDGGSYAWGDALAYCASLGAGWRAPSLTEAQSIIDDAHEFPAVDPVAFPDTPSVDFWTSSAAAGGSGAAWYVDFFYGASDNNVATSTFRVRCVR